VPTCTPGRIRETRFRKTRKTEVEAQIELGKLLELAWAGRRPDSGVTVAELLEAYLPVAGWDVSTEETNLGYIRRTIKPALGAKEVRKVGGPLLDNLHARLKQCGNLACAGKPFTEHRHVPGLRPDPSDRRTDWEQATEKLREAIACGALAPGDALPSVPELARLQGLKPGTVRHAFLLLAADGLLVIRHGRTTQVAGDPPEISDPAARYRSARSRPGHDCKLSGCRPHSCGCYGADRRELPAASLAPWKAPVPPVTWKVLSKRRPAVSGLLAISQVSRLDLQAGHVCRLGRRRRVPVSSAWCRLAAMAC
jgi:DNA-binding transcriptional regulator YhcF (GntR family)